MTGSSEPSAAGPETRPAKEPLTGIRRDVDSPSGSRGPLDDHRPGGARSASKAPGVHQAPTVDQVPSSDEVPCAPGAPRVPGPPGAPGARDPLGALGTLGDPTRRSLYDLVVEAAEPITRDQAAARLGIPRSTATFHLTRLVEAGMVQATFAKLTGRTGPGSGRPAKLYAPATEEIAASVPPRHYDLAARVLADAVERSAATGSPVTKTLQLSAAAAGRDLAADALSLLDVLRTNGFRPHLDENARVVLGNCPFHRLVEDHPEIVCTLNLHLLRGAAQSTGESDLDLALEPAAGRCCVTIRGLAGREGRQQRGTDDSCPPGAVTERSRAPGTAGAASPVEDTGRGTTRDTAGS